MAAKSLLLPIGLAVADQNTTFEARDRMAALVRKGDVPRDLICDAMVRQPGKYDGFGRPDAPSTTAMSDQPWPWVHPKTNERRV